MSPSTLPPAHEVIARLGLKPHPEGGFFRETWRDMTDDGSRGSGTAILFLLREGDRSRWHRIDSTEIWHFYEGAPLELSIAEDGEAVQRWVLGPGLFEGESPQAIVPPDAWQSARSLGDWTLVGCTVSPAFDFDFFELADDDFDPAAVSS
ncbi:MAG: cupin [Phycisphaerae bacterium]|nr:cupin [Phycisphaerae bacterium]MDG1899839.1 cupin domain-containing protein [Phycisphaerales bacterium]